jgi:hypothetical protein
VPEPVPVVSACSYDLFHCPYFAVEHGTTPASEREANPGSAFLTALPLSLRSFAAAAAYPPNRAFIGALDPRRLPERPWHLAADGAGTQGAGGAGAAGPGAAERPVPFAGPMGRILPEKALYALMKVADAFDLVLLEKGFRDEAVEILRADGVLAEADAPRFKDAADAAGLQAEIAAGALPLVSCGLVVGCVKSAHPTDPNLGAHTMLENLASKATAVYALRRLLADNAIDPLGIDYVLETSEEACGDMNQRGGGNFAKAIGELGGLANATGADIRSFCAGPVHGLLQAAALVRSSIFRRVVVLAGGTTAKLAMNAKKHIEKKFPVLEDCMGSFAFLVEADAPRGMAVRTDAVGRHRIGSGSSPQAVIQDLVAAPLAAAGLSFGDVDVYAPELQNPEITEAAGAGNVTLANLKMIAATAVMKKEISKEEMGSFIAAHGTSGWAPTQGHIPSGVPALGWFIRWAAEGSLKRGLVIGKGSLFLGRMTNLFDGVSLILEARGLVMDDEGRRSHGGRQAPAEAPKAPTGTLRIGLTLPGSESGEEELRRGAALAAERDAALEVKLFGEGGADAIAAHRDMETAIADGSVHGAVTFHYPFPIGIATVGHTKAPGNERDLFIATTTGTTATDRVEAMVRNAISGAAVARACGIPDPTVGLLNLDGAASALKILKDLTAAGLPLRLSASGRGDALLRGNDILAGSVDVLVCDSLTGNAVVKLLAAYPTAGVLETAGSGYGPGVGTGVVPVGIISRATGAEVAANAILLMARALRGGLSAVHAEALRAADAAGLSRLLAERGGQRAAAPAAGPAGAAPAAGPARKAVDREIEGVDVLEIDAAVAALRAAGLYCEAGMGCTGPVILVSRLDEAKAKELLKGARFL